MRMVIAKLDVDEDILFDIGYEGIIDGLEKEFGRLSPSGINLEEAFIADEDDEVEFGRYINYVVRWAFKHAMDESEGDDMLLNFAEWKKGACGL